MTIVPSGVKLNCLMVPTPPSPSRVVTEEKICGKTNGQKLWLSFTVAFHSLFASTLDTRSVVVDPATIFTNYPFNSANKMEYDPLVAEYRVGISCLLVNAEEVAIYTFYAAYNKSAPLY